MGEAKNRNDTEIVFMHYPANDKDDNSRKISAPGMKVYRFFLCVLPGSLPFRVCMSEGKVGGSFPDVGMRISFFHVL